MKTFIFMLNRWASENLPEFVNVINTVAGLYISGQLEMPEFHKFPLEQYKEAFKAAMQGFTNKKVLLQLTQKMGIDL